MSKYEMTIKEMKNLCRWLHDMMEEGKTAELNEYFKNIDLMPQFNTRSSRTKTHQLNILKGI